jgi:hypothetical protein
MTRIGLAVASIGMAAALTACGGGDDFTDQSGEEIADAAKEAMKGLDALKVSGAITTDGQEIELDIQTNADGDCTGSIGTGDGTAQLLGVAGKVWFKPDEAFWRASAGDAADQLLTLVGDKWVVVPASDDSFNRFCNVDDLIAELVEDDGEESTYSKGDTEDVDGDETIAFDNKDKDGTSTGYVLVDEPHYLVKIEKTEGEDTGSVTFSEFDEEFDVEAPAADEAVDLENAAG